MKMKSVHFDLPEDDRCLFGNQSVFFRPNPLTEVVCVLVKTVMIEGRLQVNTRSLSFSSTTGATQRITFSEIKSIEKQCTMPNSPKGDVVLITTREGRQVRAAHST